MLFFFSHFHPVYGRFIQFFFHPYAPWHWNIYLPGDSANVTCLGWWVTSGDLEKRRSRRIVTSNQRIKRSRIESPGAFWGCWWNAKKAWRLRWRCCFLLFFLWLLFMVAGCCPNTIGGGWDGGVIFMNVPKKKWHIWSNSPGPTASVQSQTSANSAVFFATKKSPLFNESFRFVTLWGNWVKTGWNIWPSHIYLEPKWHLFWLEKAFFCRVQAPK